MADALWGTITALVCLAESRDDSTGGHLRRISETCRVVATALSLNSVYSGQLTREFIINLQQACLLHDIGKVGIPDSILLKPGRLDEGEFAIMKTHARLGRDAIQAAEDHLGMPVEFLTTAKEIARYHQEKWDGSGYPEGLAGERIPLSARLMALADVYDALISRRIYKEPMPHADAVKSIAAGRGRHFDPDVVDAFLARQDEFREIAERFGESGSQGG